MCNKITVIVNDLKKVHGAQINFVTRSMSSPGAAEEVKKVGIKSHGIIARDADGKLVTTVEGHNYQKDKIEAVVKVLLPKKS
jgi:aerobic-type carbon monoxide dehydrogenase small subunit (CoxS/CutS family)